jgi:hypothetical protein
MIAQATTERAGVQERVAPTPEPLLVGAKDLARLLAVSEATLWRWHSSGELGPAGVMKCGRRLWTMAEVKEWVSAGLPSREAWLALRAGTLRV